MKSYHCTFIRFNLNTSAFQSCLIVLSYFKLIILFVKIVTFVGFHQYPQGCLWARPQSAHTCTCPRRPLETVLVMAPQVCITQSPHVITATSRPPTAWWQVSWGWRNSHNWLNSWRYSLKSMKNYLDLYQMEQFKRVYASSFPYILICVSEMWVHTPCKESIYQNMPKMI